VKRIGQTDVRVSELGFGGAPIGNLYRAVTDGRARAAIDTAWQHGVRYFDTAPHYGLGLSERRLGTALAGRSRGDFVLSTKVGRLLEDNPMPTGSDLASGGFAVPDTLRRRLDFSAAGVRRTLEGSLERLAVDRVDIVLVHDPDDHLEVVVAETIPTLQRLRDKGMVSAIGVAMNGWRPLLRLVDQTGIDVVMLAGRWTLVDRSGGPLLDACDRRGVSVLAAGPFNSGLLARSWPPSDAMYDYARASADVLARARALAAACRARGVELPHAALLFPLRHPAVASVVAGVRSAPEAESAAAWAGAPLPDDLWEAL
jgi:D-threo-aldose 1-dehydrogenase